MRTYELTLVINPDTTSELQKKLITKIKKLVEEAKGKVEKADDWGKKDFAYPVAKKTFGYFQIFTINLPQEAAVGLDKKLKLEEEILRYLIVKREGPAFAKATAGKEGKHGAKITQ